MRTTQDALPCSAVPALDKCAVDGCSDEPVCLLSVEGEWFPICRTHSMNRLLPRRNLRLLGNRDIAAAKCVEQLRKLLSHPRIKCCDAEQALAEYDNLRLPNDPSSATTGDSDAGRNS